MQVFSGRPFLFLAKENINKQSFLYESLYHPFEHSVSLLVFCTPLLQKSCKIKMQVIAERFCRLLHLHFVGYCKGLCRPVKTGTSNADILLSGYLYHRNGSPLSSLVVLYDVVLQNLTFFNVFDSTFQLRCFS